MSYPFGYGVPQFQTPSYPSQGVYSTGQPTAAVMTQSPIASLVYANQLRKALSGKSSRSSGVSIVTYKDEFGEEFVKNTLKISEEDIKNYGEPMGVKYGESNVVIPLPFPKALEATIDGQTKAMIRENGVSEDSKKETLRHNISKGLAEEYFPKCGPADRDLSEPGCGINYGSIKKHANTTFGAPTSEHSTSSDGD